MSNSANAEEHRTEIALFRYTLILPLLREPSARARQQMRRNLATVVYDLRHSDRHLVSVATLLRWEARYREGGFEALKPQPRADRGQPRTPSPLTRPPEPSAASPSALPLAGSLPRGTNSITPPPTK